MSRPDKPDRLIYLFRIRLCEGCMKRLALVILFISFSAGGLFASYEKALELFNQKNYNESLKILADSLVAENDFKDDSANYKIRFLAAHNHWKLGNKESAVSHFKRCMDIKKDDVGAYIDLAFFLTEINRLNDAETTAQGGIKIKQDPILYYLVGKVSLLRGNFWRAKEFLEKANSLDPELYFSYNCLGIALMNLKKFSEANTAFTVASALYPESSQILNNLGMSYEMLGKYEQAARYYEKANILVKDDRTILANMQRLRDKKDK